MTVGMLAMFGLGAVSSFPAGWALARLQLARHSALLNDAIKAGHTRLYASMADGRRQEYYRPDRYSEENRA